MLKLTLAFAAALALAVQANMHEKHHDDLHENKRYYHSLHQRSNATYSVPSMTYPGPSGSSNPIPTGTNPNSPITASPPMGTGSSGTGSPSSASGGFSQSSNNTAVTSTVNVLTTEIVYTTVTSCPVTKTHGSGASQSLEVITTVSTVKVTSTKTICTKCVAPPNTGAPSSDMPVQGPIAPYPTGSGLPEGSNPSGTAPSGAAPAGTGAAGPGSGSENQNSPAQTGDTILTYTLGSGSSTTVVTTTIKHTHTATSYETVYQVPTAAGQTSPGESNSPQNGAEQNSNQITATVQSTHTSTNYVYASGAAASQGGSCPQQVTVTVPGPDVTVTVTAMGGPPSGVPGGPESPISASTLFPTAPFGNGTSPVSTGGRKKKCKSTGFITKSSASATFNLYPSNSDVFPTASAYAKRH